MNIDSQKYVTQVAKLESAGGGQFGLAPKVFIDWILRNKLPVELSELYQHCAPLSEFWAGAGTLFSYAQIIHWNDDFPDAIKNLLLIIGSAPNGDHICMNLKNGEVGYLDHEQAWQATPHLFFISVSNSIGAFLEEINAEGSNLPEDYWEAKKNT